MSKIVIEEKRIDDIPLLEYVDVNNKPIGLVFVQHGFTSNKERGSDFLALNLARKGFLVVAIDAYKHGKRIQEPFISKPLYKQYFDIFTVVKRTARDIDRLFRKYYHQTYEKYDVVGVSMGGMIAFYLTTISKNLSRVIPVISAPDFFELSIATFSDDLQDYQQYVHNKKGYIDKISPINHIELMKFEKMFMLNTTKDPMVPYQLTKNFYESFNLPNSYFKLYEDVHNVNREMQEDIICFLLDDTIFEG